MDKTNYKRINSCLKDVFPKDLKNAMKRNLEVEFSATHPLSYNIIFLKNLKGKLLYAS